MAAAGSLPFPSRHRERISGEFPSVIERLPKCGGGFQHVFDFLHMPFDADAARTRVKVMMKSNVGGVIHKRRHAPLLGREDVASITAKSNANRFGHQQVSLPSNADGTDPHGHL